MKTKLIALLLPLSLLAVAQPDTEVYLFEIKVNNSQPELRNGKNISNNAGYDNQPNFYSDDIILFASTRNGQTDIASYTIKSGKLDYISNTKKGGEYSPQKIPKKFAISAVRLDDDGKQRLYEYTWSDGTSTELIKDLVVAYYTWSDENTVVSAVIEDENLNLYASNISNGTNRKYATKVGRSFHIIPGSNLVSYISKQNDAQWQIRSVDPSTGNTRLLANTLKDVEDICWLDNRTILSAKGSIVYKLTLQQDNNWKKVADLSSQGISTISRLAVNGNSTQLALAAETNIDENTSTSNTSQSSTPSEAEAIVQKQLDAYNARDIDAFMATYTNNVKIFNFPNTLMSEGQAAMRPGYETFFKNTPDLHCEILERIVIGNKVIDHEYVTVNGNTFKAVAIYEVENGLIAKVTFIR
ncbi:nuclear transport factor 2 family protein [Winogradskyella sp. A3E31]|uniref:nuclear transport factor 2 family protein n=1 Tax=Winogradskyella sp. A3E31 TaxID=3349637 RepID=UPI00398B9A60